MEVVLKNILSLQFILSGEKINMVGLRQVRYCLMTSDSLSIINIKEFILLYQLNSSKNTDFSFWCHENFDLDKFNDDEYKVSFRFLKNDVYFLKEVLGIPDQIIFKERCLLSQRSFIYS